MWQAQESDVSRITLPIWNEVNEAARTAYSLSMVDLMHKLLIVVV